MSSHHQGVPIAEVAARTGIGVGTLRQWERRYGWPQPARLPGGHRRYSESDVSMLQRVLAERRAGRSTQAAMVAARAAMVTTEDTTVFAGLRRRRPDLAPLVLSRSAMLALSRAIEDECVAAGAEAHLVAAFQRASTYREARQWEPLRRMATSTIVFADFRRSRVTADGTREVSIPDGAALEREWAVVCDAPTFSGVLAGWERADGRFEALWTVEPTVARAASTVARDLATRHAPALVLPAPPEAVPAPVGDAVLARAVSVTGRAIAHLGGDR